MIKYVTFESSWSSLHLPSVIFYSIYVSDNHTSQADEWHLPSGSLVFVTASRSILT